MPSGNPLHELTSVDAYVRDRHNIFPSIWSWIWFERQNREALVKAGAVVVMRGRKMVVPSVCDATVLKIGRTAAKRSSALGSGTAAARAREVA